MKKKNINSKLRIALSVLLSLIVAVAFWFMVKYSQLTGVEMLASLVNDFVC